MTLTIEAKDVVISKDLTKAELASGATWLMENSAAVKRWVKKGLPKEDIPLETRNVIGEQRFKVEYLEMRDRKCKQHQLEEYDYVYQLLRHMADTMTPAN